MHRLMACATASSSSLPIEAELHLVLVGVADRQFRSLQWVAEACRLDAEVDDLPVGQDERSPAGCR